MRRREFMGLVGGAAAGLATPALAADIPVRMTAGLRATGQFVVWLGTEAGVFKKHGLDATIPKLEVGGPESVAGLLRGDWEFIQTGAAPMIEAVLKGADAVILLRNTDPHAGIFIMTRSEFTALDQLGGKRVGVLTNTEVGQTGIVTRQTLGKAGVTASYVGLGTYQNIYRALAAGTIDAGALPVDLRFPGQAKYGWRAFEADRSGFAAPSVFGTRRRSIAANRETVLRAVRGFVEAIHVFKTRRDIVVPMLQRYMGIEDRQAVEALYEFYVPLFPKVPRPSFSDFQSVKDYFSTTFPAARDLKESDIADASLIDEVERSGFIDKLYA
ncbi:MAG: ABC transporter substrate-binding protein [Proteobacteria bacterium]|nr:ABC transporter substrate-binding protein [Pseudomonadota bacterium]MBI3499248.1 ABC transporter substrate-binding protein [Pseudomonadota bacterium]